MSSTMRSDGRDAPVGEMLSLRGQHLRQHRDGVVSRMSGTGVDRYNAYKRRATPKNTNDVDEIGAHAARSVMAQQAAA